MNPEVLHSLQHSAALLFASVVLITIVFLIARVVRVRQTLAIAIALSPMLAAFALQQAVSAASALI